MKLHIISLDVPFPPDYGGMVDVFYKVKNLFEAGVKIYLHRFEYGRGEPQKLSLRLPYMVYSRRDEALLNNLKRIDAPILFEGVHTAYYLSHPVLEGRFKLMRNQNLEQEYYSLLAEREPSFLKKLYFSIEAKLLKIKESKLDATDIFLTVSEHDHDFFKQEYPQKRHEYIPSFQPYNDVKSLPGKGEYVLYHGNLGHSENVEAALFLLEQVCPKSNIPFIFAGKDPDEKVIAACEKLPHCNLIPNPSMQHMEQLIAEAQIHALPTFQATGLKLKLLLALFNGRHVLVNDAMLRGTGLSAVCQKAETPLSFLGKIKELMNISFDEEAIRTRRSLLLQRYDNRKNALRIIACLPK